MKRSVSVILFGLLIAGAAQAATLFGLVNTGELFASTDQGATWTVRSTLPVRDAVAIAAGASASHLYLASASGVVYRTSDAGATWSGTGAVAASDVADLLVRPDLSVLVLTSSGTLYRSMDQGATFTATAALTGSNFASLALTTYGRKLYALTRTGETSESLDGGTNWTTKGTVAVSDAVKLCGLSSMLYLLTSSGDLYSSADGGTTWLAVGTLSQVGLTSLVNDRTTLIAAAGTGEVATSMDGVAWTWRGAINQMTVRSLGIDSPAAGDVEPPDGATGFAVSAPWPNPSTRGQSISIAFRLPEDTRVQVELYDIAGRRVAERPAEVLPAGAQRLQLDAGARASGVYWIHVRVGSGRQVDRRLVVLQ